MQASNERILTTHTGSLPRPPAMLDLLKARDAGEAVDPAAFDAAVRSAVRDVVQRQVACGIDVVNDGEMAKMAYSTYVKDRLTGFNGIGNSPVPLDVQDFPGFQQRFYAQSGRRTLTTPACDAPVTWRDPDAVLREIAAFGAALVDVSPVDRFMTAASPGVISVFLENKYYDTHEAYIAALAEVMKREYDAIHQAGFLLQLDCPDLGSGRHTRFGALSTTAFLDVAHLHIDAINRAIADIPAERVRLHLCWGNYPGPHHRDIPLSDLMAPVLRAKVGVISFEAANPRHGHEWIVFRDIALPPEMAVMPGVIDSTTNYIEHPELVAQRIERFAEVVGRERVIAGTDCGFATFATHPGVDPDIAWAKLKSLAEGAAIASARLWGRKAA
jgi:5-methyltetrahydropteroyltriglutamate--homocysteine methyltransferase